MIRVRRFSHDSVPIVGVRRSDDAAGFGIGTRFLAVRRHRRTLRSQEATGDDALDAPDPMP
jgi:hypothetical protein